ncbi:MAG: ROK family protein [Gemmataceae bacterium]
MNYLAIEIGGTKLQLGVGPDDGRLRALWRSDVVVAHGAAGIRQQIMDALPVLLRRAGLRSADLIGVGIGFGGPTDDATQTVIRSHHVAGWDNFPLVEWVRQTLHLPAVLGNDADVAGLGEAIHGAARGMSPVFYITLGSGIGGGFILDGTIYRGVGRGAAEIGHLRFPFLDGKRRILEHIASGWGIARVASELARSVFAGRTVLNPDALTAVQVACAAREGDACAQEAMRVAIDYLAEAVCQVIALLCPQRIVIGGGVSLLGDQLFDPLRAAVAEKVFQPFAGLTDIVHAALGEEVVLHGAIALAHRTLVS